MGPIYVPSQLDQGPGGVKMTGSVNDDEVEQYFNFTYRPETPCNDVFVWQKTAGKPSCPMLAASAEIYQP